MLLVSRPDINVDAITEIDPQQRFIKLPITNYLKLLDVYDTINRPQIALINAVNDPKYRFICAALARRLGKTYIANIIGQLVTLVPQSNVLIISPNYNLSSISFELQRKLIKHFDLEVSRDNLKDKIIELSNGSTIRMGSLSTVDSTVGRSYDLIIFDEAALGEGGEAAFNVALRPTLDKPNAKAIFISTPRGRNNWFSQFWNRGFDNNFPEWISLQADYTENTRMAESDVQEAKRSMSKAEFEQEYLASFTVFAGQIYTLQEENVCEPPENLKGEAIAGCDPGYRDSTAFAVIVYDYQTDIFYIVDEYLRAEKTTQEHAVAFQELNARWGVEIVFIDSAAAQFANDLAYLYNISTTKAKKDVLPGIAYVQTLLQQNRLRVAPHCTHVRAMFDQYRWDQREGLQRERPMHDEYSHMADAIRYALYTYTV
ncbi:Terminase-like family [uncultured Caudovirales phage]|uniref:Terminase-like family n=1 Tax=uncultured Caudovirales phage TaxID=2100421 RepID=A0A6J7WP32_9CAUD|nr:Terminase-like family [uncultured Caudovirales phage]